MGLSAWALTLEVFLSVPLPPLSEIGCLEGFWQFIFPQDEKRVVSSGEQGFVMGNAMGNIEYWIVGKTLLNFISNFIY